MADRRSSTLGRPSLPVAPLRRAQRRGRDQLAAPSPLGRATTATSATTSSIRRPARARALRCSRRPRSRREGWQAEVLVEGRVPRRRPRARSGRRPRRRRDGRRPRRHPGLRPMARVRHGTRGRRPPHSSRHRTTGRRSDLSQLWWYTARAGGIVAWALLVAERRVGSAALDPGAAAAACRPRGSSTCTGSSVASRSSSWACTSSRSCSTPTCSSRSSTCSCRSRRRGIRSGSRGGSWRCTSLLAVEITSLLRRQLPAKVWRRTHVLSLPLFLLATVHFIVAGTDADQPYAFVGIAVAAFVVGGLVGRRLLDVLAPSPAPARIPVRIPVRAVAPGTAGAGRVVSPPDGREPGGIEHGHHPQCTRSRPRRGHRRADPRRRLRHQRGAVREQGGWLDGEPSRERAASGHGGRGRRGDDVRCERRREPSAAAVPPDTPVSNAQTSAALRAGSVDDNERFEEYLLYRQDVAAVRHPGARRRHPRPPDRAA